VRRILDLPRDQRPQSEGEPRESEAEPELRDPTSQIEDSLVDPGIPVVSISPEGKPPEDA